MKEWTKIEDKYTSLAKTNKEDADTLNHEMTKQFEVKKQCVSILNGIMEFLEIS